MFVFEDTKTNITILDLHNHLLDHVTTNDDCTAYIVDDISILSLLGQLGLYDVG
jgi:hypothetical protein